MEDGTGEVPYNSPGRRQVMFAVRQAAHIFPWILTNRCLQSYSVLPAQAVPQDRLCRRFCFAETGKTRKEIQQNMRMTPPDSL